MISYNMDHMYNTRPDFQVIVDKQRIAHYRLHKDATTRTAPELANYGRVLHPVPLADLKLPKLPLVRPRAGDGKFVLLGEIAQQPGMVVVLDTASNVLSLMASEQLELVPPVD